MLCIPAAACVWLQNITGRVCTLIVIFAALLCIPTDSIWHVHPTVYVIGLQGANLFDSLIYR